MKKHILFLGLLSFTIGHSITYAAVKFSVLHLSFHKGCINDFQEVADELGLNLTTWYVLDGQYPRTYFDGITAGNAIYNIGHDRAKRIWDKHKDFFEQFDMIVTSDTAPLSRIFLQNGWKKPLIIWVCNRFDYYDGASLDCDFPDQEYYDLINAAAKAPNVKIISYTPYEHHYAKKRNVDWGTFTIKPIGKKEKPIDASFISDIPQSIDRATTLFLYPRLEKNQMAYIQGQCNQVNIKTYCGTYKGPEDLRRFKGILYFPYAWSNLALFENLQYGYVHFVPTEKFILDAMAKGLPVKTFTGQDFHLCEWYCSEYRDLFVYFDSWQDLWEKVQTTDYEALSKKVRAAGIEHRKLMLERWSNVFEVHLNNLIRSGMLRN